MDQFFPKAVSSLILAIVFISFTAQLGDAIRPNLESILYKGPVSPSDHSHCSNIPGPGKCELNEMNVAGRLTRSPPPFEYAATSMENKSNI
ncbi:hypothetical protein PTKIN_Ptkin09bG0049600 [Pterospermum kingtungense]